MCWNRSHPSGFLRRALWRKWDWHFQSKWLVGYVFNITLFLWAQRGEIWLLFLCTAAATFILWAAIPLDETLGRVPWRRAGRIALLHGLTWVCCKSASSFPKNRFFYTKHLLLISGSRGNMLFEWYNFTIGVFFFPSQTFFHLKGKEMSFCFFALYFWLLSSSIWISWITSPHSSKNKRW